MSLRHRISGYAAVVLVAFSLVVTNTHASSFSCKEIELAITHARDDSFEQCMQETGASDRCDNPYGGANQPVCEWHEDPEKRSRRCVWSFRIGDPAAFVTRDTYLKSIRECIGARSIEKQDEPVNHPDSYISNSFFLVDKTLTLSLKHKSAMALTLVSVTVSRQKQPR